MTDPELREPSRWILTVLASGRSHGYGLIEQTRILSVGRVDLRIATLYAALDRLAETGLVEIDGDEVVSGRLRRYFKITADGVERLRAEAARLEAAAAAARTALAVSARATAAPA